MTADIVILDESEFEATGLLDVNGTPLYRLRERVPFGFRGSK